MCVTALKCCRDDDCVVANPTQPPVAKQQQQLKGRAVRARLTQQNVNLESSTECMCLTCDKSFSSHRELCMHKRNHSGETTPACTLGVP